MRKNEHNEVDWAAQFPDVFDRDNPGFDVIIENPPYVGGARISGSFGCDYLKQLRRDYPETKGTCDLAAYFLRRSFQLVRRDGLIEAIATNTISQGDTRWSGLRYICKRGMDIFDAVRRIDWPGRAAVIVSRISMIRGTPVLERRIDGRSVPRITAFLEDTGDHDDPQRLRENAGRSFVGSLVLGMGFTFDDKSDKATPLAEMRRLIAADPRNGEAIFPYIGGREVNTSPTHAHHRYVINFGDLPEAEARSRYPDLMAIVEQKVKPERDRNNCKHRRQYWWQFSGTRPGLRKAIAQRDRVLVISKVTDCFALAFMPTNIVFSDKLTVFPIEQYSGFGILNSRIHEAWARYFGSSLCDRLQYSSTDCFETFPFPVGWQNDDGLGAIARQYYELRAAIMVGNGEGLTATYNRFNHPLTSDGNILELRDLHRQMDRAVLAAYGWGDLDPVCGFGLDYFEGDRDRLSPEWRDRVDTGNLWFGDADEAARFGEAIFTGRKLPWRYQWQWRDRREVINRLWDLNRDRSRRESGEAIAPRQLSLGF